MKGRFALAGLAMTLAAVLMLPAFGQHAAMAAIPSAPAISDQIRVYYDFEKTLAPWAPMTDSPFHAYKMVQQSGSNGCPDGAGSYFARLMTASKSTNPGVIAKFGTWTFAKLFVGGQGVRQVTVQWSARLSPDGIPSPTVNHAMAYAGVSAPAKWYQFAQPAPSTLTYNWQTYKYQTYVKLVPAVTGSPVYVGVGWDNVNDSIDLDCVRIAITYPVTTAK